MTVGSMEGSWDGEMCTDSKNVKRHNGCALIISEKWSELSEDSKMTSGVSGLSSWEARWESHVEDSGS